MKKASLASVLTLSVLVTMPLTVSASEDIENEVRDSTELNLETEIHLEPVETENEISEGEVAEGDNTSNDDTDTLTEEDQLVEVPEINEDIASENAEVIIDEPEVEEQVQEESVQGAQTQEEDIVSHAEDTGVIIEESEVEVPFQETTLQENQTQQEDDFSISDSENETEEWYSEDASPAQEGEYVAEEWDETYEEYYELQEDPYEGETVITAVGILDAGSNDIIEILTLYGENYQEQLESYLESMDYEAVRDIIPQSYTEEVEYEGETFTRTFNNLTIFVMTDETVMETYYDDVDSREAMRTITIHHDNGIFPPYSYVASETIDDSIRYALYNMEHVFGGQFTLGHIDVSTGYGTKTFESGESYTGHLYDIQIYLGDSYQPESEDESAEDDVNSIPSTGSGQVATDHGEESREQYDQNDGNQLLQQEENVEDEPVIPGQSSNLNNDLENGLTESGDLVTGYSTENVKESKNAGQIQTSNVTKAVTQTTEDGTKKALSDSTSVNPSEASEARSQEVLPDTGLAGNNIIIPAAVMMVLGSAFIFFTRRKQN
ncbi:LPXTG cell wall anchor domain-containing protein [Salinicoccus halitifaciens]|nr:LPXTG cell wall anchor domain-containing protein [Salinicoccus halitifaciens]